jgi:hypothetical protein
LHLDLRDNTTLAIGVQLIVNAFASLNYTMLIDSRDLIRNVYSFLPELEPMDISSDSSPSNPRYVVSRSISRPGDGINQAVQEPDNLDRMNG